MVQAEDGVDLMAEEYTLRDNKNFLPPRNVMKGGMNRAKQAGQQIAGASAMADATSSQIKTAMSPAMAKLQADLGNQQKLQNIGETMTEVRRLNAIDSMNDNAGQFNAKMDFQNKWTWDDYVVKGATLAAGVAGVAGSIAKAGEKDVTRTTVNRDSHGFVIKDEDGNPVTTTTRATERSGFAQGAHRVQSFIGHFLPSIGREQKKHDQANQQRNEAFNATQSTHAVQMQEYAKQTEAVSSVIDNNNQFAKDIENLSAQNATLSEELGKMHAVLTELNIGSTQQLQSPDPSKLSQQPERSGFATVTEDGVDYEALGNLIGSGEGNYDSYNLGRAGDSVGKDGTEAFGKSISEMTVQEVMDLQESGSLGAVGKYQIIGKTMRDIVKRGNVDTSLLMEADTQDMLANVLFTKKRPAIHEFVTSDKLTPELKHRAAKALAMEWASIADPDSGESYYKGNAGNKASITNEAAMEVLNSIRATYQKDRG